MKNCVKVSKFYLAQPKIFLIVSFVLFQINSFSQIELNSVVPTGYNEALNVGVGTADFTLEIVNGGVFTTIQSVVFQQNSGIEIESANYTIDGISYSATITNVNTISINHALESTKKLTVFYKKRATCSVIPNAPTGFSLQVNDIVTVNYTEGTKNVTTNSYPVVFPGLQVNTPASPNNNISVEFLQSFTDDIPISNVVNSGKVQDMVFTMQWETNNALSVTGMTIEGNSITQSIPFTFIGNAVEVQITKDILGSLGYTDSIFNASNSIILHPTFTVNTYFPNLKTRYSIDYKAFGNVCSRLENAEGVIYYTQIYPAPSITYSKNVLQRANWCGNKYIAEYTITNSASNIPSNYLLNSYVTFENYFSQIESVEVNGVIVPKVGNKYFLKTNKNLNNDTILSDIAGADVLTVKVIVSSIYNSDIFYTGFAIIFNGLKIDNQLYTQSLGLVRDEKRNASSYVTGPATLDEKLLPSGSFTFSYNAQINPFYKNAFLDYNVYVKLPDGSLLNPVIQGESYNGTNSTVISACMGDPLVFQLVTETSNCPNTHTVLTQAAANTVERCYSSAGGCYTTSVDTASFSTKQINTCDESELQTSGNLSYWCNHGTCPEIQKLYVNVFDNADSYNDFVIENPQIKVIKYDGSISYISGNLIANSITNSGKIFEFSYSSTCLGTEEIRKDSIVFTGVFKTAGNHFTQERKDVNIQVKYIPKDSDGLDYLGGWTWGDQISIYDPKISLNKSILLKGCESVVYLDAKVSDKAPGTSVDGVKLLNITYPGIDKFYYDSVSNVTQSFVESFTNQIIEPNQATFVNYKQIKPQCVADYEFKTIPQMQVTYVDFLGRDGCEDTKTENLDLWSGQYSSWMPTIVLHPAERQQSIGMFTTWTIKVENAGRADANFVMLKLDVDTSNLIDLFIEECKVNGVVVTPEVLGDSYYLPLSSLAVNQQKEIEITVSYAHCVNQGVSKINVKSAWSCDLLSASNFDYFDCGGTAVLELENMVAVLSATETYSNTPVELCVDIPVSVTLDNIGRADLTDLGIWFENFPTNYTLTDNKINWSYNGNSGEIINGDEPFPFQINNIFSSNTYISRQVLNSTNNPITPLTSTAPPVTLDFNVQVHCGEIPDLKFIVKGLTNCGAEQERVFNYKPKLTGFEYLDSILVSATAGTFNEYKGTANFYAAVTNTSNSLVDSAYISVFVPSGFELVDYTPVIPNSITGIEIIPKDGGNILRWELAQGIHLAPHETIAVNYTLHAIANCPIADKILVMGTLTRMKKDCNNVYCKVTQSTGAYELEVNPPTQPFSASISNTYQTCTGNSVTYTVQGTNISTVTWKLEPASIGTIVSNGNTATVTYSQAGNAVITAEVCGLCVCSTLVTSTSVQEIPIITMPDSITITYDDWLLQNTNAIPVSPTNGSFSSLDTVSGCGTYIYTYAVGNACATISKDIVITIINCCPPPSTFGDIAITEKEGVTTFDVEILKYYIAHPDKLEKIGEYELYQIKYESCDGEKTIELVPCFLKWADINGDKIIDNFDVEALMKLVK